MVSTGIDRMLAEGRHKDGGPRHSHQSLGGHPEKARPPEGPSRCGLQDRGLFWARARLPGGRPGRGRGPGFHLPRGPLLFPFWLPPRARAGHAQGPRLCGLRYPGCGLPLLYLPLYPRKPDEGSRGYGYQGPGPRPARFPIGGLEVEGAPMADEEANFVGAYRLPARYGMTVGEFALYLKGEFFPQGRPRGGRGRGLGKERFL